MIDQSKMNRATRFLMIAAAVAIIIFGINQAQSVVAQLLVSVFLALIATPTVLWLEEKRTPSSVAVLIGMPGMIALLLMIGGVVGVSLNALTEDLPVYQSRLQQEILALKPWLASKHIVVSDKILLGYLNPAQVLGLAVGMLAGMGTALSSTVLVLLTVTFILLEASSFPVKLRAVLGNPDQDFPQFRKFVHDIQRYMIIKTLINLIGAVIIGLWLLFLGVDFPVLWGLLFFLFHFIPNIGSIICAIPAILLAFIELGVGPAGLVAAGYLVVGFTLGSVVEPRVMGRRLGLSTLVVFLSLIFWGSMLGPIGMILCVPITMTLKFGLEINKDTRWSAVLLGPEKLTGSVSARPNLGLDSEAGKQVDTA